MKPFRLVYAHKLLKLNYSKDFDARSEVPDVLGGPQPTYIL
jgi:hypothetical protein